MTVTAAVQTAWQQRAVACLAALLQEAAGGGLPPLHWGVDSAGCGLVGRSVAVPASRRRADLEAWAAALGVTLVTAGGRFAVGTAVRGPCTIALTADIGDDTGEGSRDGG